MSGDSSSLIDHVLKREAMPGIEGLQATYVRYFRSAEAHALLAWQLPASLKNLDVITRNDNARLPPDHPLLTGEAPESISMKLLQSPAEFAVPVKQDKCVWRAVGTGEAASACYTGWMCWRADARTSGRGHGGHVRAHIPR